MRRIASTIVALLLGVGALTAPAYAISMNPKEPNHAVTWEDWGGTRVHGYVQIKPSYNDHGHHAKRGCIKFTRQAGPALNTGWRCTSTAYSRRQTKIYHFSTWVWDSPLWGDSHVTKFRYKADWF